MTEFAPIGFMYSFTEYDAETKDVSVTKVAYCEGYDDIIQQFANFLRGCGYVVNHEVLEADVNAELADWEEVEDMIVSGPLDDDEPEIQPMH